MDRRPDLTPLHPLAKGAELRRTRIQGLGFLGDQVDALLRGNRQERYECQWKQLEDNAMSVLRYMTFAEYNRWANRRVYAAASRLTDAQYREDRGAFFRSVHGTLNHLLVADRLWLGRLAGESATPIPLDAIAYEELAELAAARELEDARICAFAAGLDPARIDAPFRYVRASTGENLEAELGATLDHVFNHQTHHRGQVHAMLTALVGTAPELDLIFFQRETGRGVRIIG
jgi:uncharacterized damage-inducible protein DinB